MNVGADIRWETPSGKTLEGRILQVPTATGPMQPAGASMLVVRDADGIIHQFDAWTTPWEIIRDNPENN